jgi:hypothetical protein
VAKDAKTRAKARVLYEAGQSFAQIAPKVKASVRVLKDWCKNEGWIKGESAPKLHQKAADALEAEAERHGVTKARILAKVGELLDAKSIAAVTTQGAISLCPLPATSKAKLGGKEAVAGIDGDVVPDRATQIAAAKMGIDVLGMKKEVVTVNPSDEMRKLWALAKGQA